MNKKSFLVFITLLFSLLVFSVFAQVSIGVKEGDWIEYEITYTGTPPQTYPKTARFEVQSIQGTNITLEINTVSLEAVEITTPITFNIEDGAPDFIIIPSNLNVGNEVNHSELGIIEIIGIGEYSFEGITRELIYGSFGDLDYNWDRTTGIVIQIDQTTDTYTQSWLAVNTNIVQTEISELDPMLLYSIIIAIIVILVVVTLLILKRKN